MRGYLERLQTGADRTLLITASFNKVVNTVWRHLLGLERAVMRVQFIALSSV
jgi:hypothetical protein